MDFVREFLPLPFVSLWSWSLSAMTQPLSFILGNLTNRSSSFTLSSAEGALRIFIVVARFEIATRRHPVSDKMTHIGWFDLMGDFCNLLIIAPYICLDSCYSWNCRLSSRNFCWYCGGKSGTASLGWFPIRKIYDCPPELANPRLFIPIWRGSIYPGLPIQHHIYGNILEYTVSGQYIE